MKHRLSRLAAGAVALGLATVVSVVGASTPVDAATAAYSSCTATVTHGSYTASVYNTSCTYAQASISFIYNSGPTTYYGVKVSAKNTSTATAATADITNECAILWLGSSQSPCTSF